MKVIIAAALLWILARQSFGTYLSFATTQNVAKGSTE